MGSTAVCGSAGAGSRSEARRPGSWRTSKPSTPPGATANLCLSGLADGTARLWDLNSNSDRALHTLGGRNSESASQDYHRTPVSAVAFAADGKICATGCEDGEIIVWNVSSGDSMYKIPAHRAVAHRQDAAGR